MANVASNLPPVEKAFPPAACPPPARGDATPAGNWRQWANTVAMLIADHPGASLASAFIVGAAVAWWIKRR